MDLQGRIQDLQSTLNSISKDLIEIKKQNKFILLFFRNLNKDKINGCVDQMDAALKQFSVAHDIAMESIVEEILSRYSIMTTQLVNVEAKVDIANANLVELTDAVKNLRPHNAPETIPRQNMPPPHRIFYGRQPLVDDIVRLLEDPNTSRVCIAGPGGMGKTSVALAVMQSLREKRTFRSEHMFWVPCVEAQSADMLRRILYTQLRVTADSYMSLDPLIDELNVSSPELTTLTEAKSELNALPAQRRLLLLDNFETPWFSGDANQAQVNDILSQLAALPHVSLLVTMTSGFPPSDGSDDVKWYNKELSALDEAAASDTFKDLYPDAAVERLDQLLEAVDGMPLAIHLMAVEGRRSNASPEELLDQWGKTGTEMISTGSSKSMDRTISMSMNRDIMKNNPSALKLLAIVAMLPAGTTGDNLLWWTSLASFRTDVATLRTAALIEHEDGKSFATSRFFVRPTIQAYMAGQGRIPAEVRQQVHDACYKFILDHKSTPDDANFKRDLEALRKEETNIQGLLMQTDTQDLCPRALEALLAFSLYQLKTKPSTVVAQHALKIALAAKDDFRIAEAHKCLGKIALALDRYEEACEHFEEARRYFRGLPGGPDRQRAGKCSLQLADAWQYLHKPSPEIRLLVLEAQADLSHDESDKLHVARGLLGLANFLWDAEENREALEALDTAKMIFEDLNRPASTAECLYLITRALCVRSNYLQALPIAEQTLAKAEQSGDDFLIWLGLSVVAPILLHLSRHDEAFPILNRMLGKSQALGRPLAIAQTLEMLGYNRAAKMDLSAARDAYQGARLHFSKVSSEMGEDGKERCSDNLNKLEAQGVEAGLDLSELTKFVPEY
ncbi:P-loop containing nucleoside triphosphate hydrolase protein [Mycena galopus ATCC 62051]|nr:P-loop containing nucleoside triphosphate hydrolase protein [Mycena galopus ATCC 62051]